MMKNQNLSVLVASSPALDSYHLSLAFAEQGITQLTQVSLEREQIIKQALINNHSVIALDVIGLSVEEAQSLVSNLVHRTGCKVIAIGDDEKIAYYRSLLSAGALEYLVNPIAPDALASLDFGHHHNGNQSGKRISVVGTKGGVGTSTVVANLARMMNSRGQSTAVADLDFASGDLDLHFDVQGNTALVEMLQYPERLEPVVFERSGITVQPDLTLFTGYLPLDTDPFWPDKNALEHFSKYCLEHADNLIFDIPSFSLRDQVGMSVLKSADVRVIVVELTLSSIRNAGQIFSFLSAGAEAGLAKENLLVVNHTKSNKASLIALNDVHRALGVDIDVSVPFAPNHFLAKESLGQSAIKGNRKVSQAFSDLADKVEGTPQSRSFRFWKRGA